MKFHVVEITILVFWYFGILVLVTNLQLPVHSVFDTRLVTIETWQWHGLNE